MINKFKSICKKADLFGQSIQLNLSSKNTYKTFFGGIFSVGFLTIITLIFWSSVNLIYDC